MRKKSNKLIFIKICKTIRVVIYKVFHFVTNLFLAFMTDNLSRVALRESKIIYLSQPLYLLQRVRIFVEPLKLVVNGASLKLVRQSLHAKQRGARRRGRGASACGQPPGAPNLSYFLLLFSKWRVDVERMNSSNVSCKDTLLSPLTRKTQCLRYYI